MRIHYITNTQNGLKIGERNQVLGVVDALREHYKGAILLEHDVSSIARLRELLKQYEKQLHVIIGVSDSGVAAFSGLFPTNNHVTILMGHEMPDNMLSVADKVDILAVPGYVANCPSTIEGVKIVRTDGVSNTMSAAKAESAYKAWQGKFTIKDNQPAIVALLGGTVDGKGYLLGEARSIAEYVAGKARQVGAYVLFSNSPRSSPQDTQDFMDVLCNAGCENAFFPFDIKNQNNETPYRAMLGMVARNPANAIIVTGDSVSMPCEIAKVVPPQQIYIYPVSCQNQQNNEFVTWMACSGRAAVVNTKEGMEKRVSGTMAKSTMDAAGQVADVVLELIKQWINV